MMRISTRLPEGRAGRALAVAALLGLLAIVIFGLLLPAGQWYAARQEQLSDAREQVANILALQRILPQLQQRADAAAAASGKTRMLLGGDTDSVAEANLQSSLTALADASGTSLTSVTALPSQAVGALQRVGIQVNVSANWQTMTILLTSIEAARPRMILSDMTINSADAPAGQPNAAMQASFSVSAFRAAGPP